MNNCENQYQEFILQEIKDTEKNLSRTWIWGLILSCSISTYMWIFIALPFKQTVLNHDNLGKFAAYKVDSLVGDVLNNSINSLVYAAPKFAEISAQRIKSVLPTISVNGKNNIDRLENMIPELNATSIKLIDQHLNSRESEIKEFVARKGIDGFIKNMAKEVLDNAINTFDEHLELKARGTSIREFNSASLTFLREINEELRRLSMIQPLHMTEAEKLKRRLIVSWSALLSEQFTKINS
jgi:hypothetical protein